MLVDFASCWTLLGASVARPRQLPKCLTKCPRVPHICKVFLGISSILKDPGRFVLIYTECRRSSASVPIRPFLTPLPRSSGSSHTPHGLSMLGPVVSCWATNRPRNMHFLYLGICVLGLPLKPRNRESLIYMYCKMCIFNRKRRQVNSRLSHMFWKHFNIAAPLLPHTSRHHRKETTSASGPTNPRSAFNRVSSSGFLFHRYDTGNVACVHERECIYCFVHDKCGTQLWKAPVSHLFKELLQPNTGKAHQGGTQKPHRLCTKEAPLGYSPHI